MKTKATEQNIEKYINVLSNLRIVLNFNPNQTIIDFCEKSKVTKNLSKTLQDLNILKKMPKKQWKWIGGNVDRAMAISVLQKQTEYNKPRISKSKNKSILEHFKPFSIATRGSRPSQNLDLKIGDTQFSISNTICEKYNIIPNKTKCLLGYSEDKKCISILFSDKIKDGLYTIFYSNDFKTRVYSNIPKAIKKTKLEELKGIYSVNNVETSDDFTLLHLVKNNIIS